MKIKYFILLINFKQLILFKLNGNCIVLYFLCYNFTEYKKVQVFCLEIYYFIIKLININFYEQTFKQM